MSSEYIRSFRAPKATSTAYVSEDFLVKINWAENGHVTGDTDKIAVECSAALTGPSQEHNRPDQVPCCKWSAARDKRLF